MIEFELSSKLLSPTWWLEYLKDFATREPAHLAVEILCLGIILYLLFAPSYNLNDETPLTTTEEDALIAEWNPEPVVPVGFADSEENEAEVIVDTFETGATISVDGVSCLNFGSTNFLGLANVPEIRTACKETITKYGVGSCGPRGFYGTIDKHLQLENTFAQFMGTEDAILYSDSLACLASVIPAFCKAGDYIIADEFVNAGIQQGLKLSRSKVVFFKHNDAKSLKVELEKCDKAWTDSQKLKSRRFIVVEGISQYYGDIAPLKEIYDLAREFKFRIILDDSHAIGVLGKNGRGTSEHVGLKPTDIDIIATTLDTTVASVGGICVGSKQIVSHQRLSGLGYCFSAASPPYTAVAATMAVGYIHSSPHLSQQLREKSTVFFNALRKAAASVDMEVSGDSISPLVHLRIKADKYAQWGLDSKDRKQVRSVLKQIQQRLRVQHQLCLTVSNYLKTEAKAPCDSIRCSVNVLHEAADAQMLADAIIESVNAVRASLTKCDLDM